MLEQPDEDRLDLLDPSDSECLAAALPTSRSITVPKWAKTNAWLTPAAAAMTRAEVPAMPLSL